MKQVYILILGVLINSTAFSQVVPELIFKNPTLTGNDGATGTVYKFATVTTGVDALVKISDRSSNKVTLSAIDLTSSGYANSFQPQISYDGGDVLKNTTYWMEFTISFVTSLNNAVPVTVAGFNVTSIDMDGDGDRLREQVTFFGSSGYTVENPTSITVSNVTGGKVFTGSTDDYPNINTSATNIMVTSRYINTSNFRVRVGAVSGNKASDGAERMSSLWFKSFTYSNPSTLPIKLNYFKARKDNHVAILDWSTSMEKEFSHFIVERSADGDSYNDIATISSPKTNSNTERVYSYNDNKSSQMAVVYYRLKMVDIDGKFKYSEVKIIRNANDQSSVVAFPNPAISEIRINIPASWQNKAVTYSIYHINGSVVKQKISPQASQTETFNLSGLQSGTYLIKVAAGSESVVKQFSKQG